MLIEQRAFKPVLGAIAGVAHFIIGYEQIQADQLFSFSACVCVCVYSLPPKDIIVQFRS